MTDFRTKIWFIAFCLILLSLLSASCSTAENQIIGKWEEVGGDGGTVSFYKDGTVIFGDSVFGNLSGTYAFVDKSTIKVEMSGFLALGGAQLFEISISNGSMTMTNSGYSSNYKKNR
jgi:hypothetical protein